MNEKIYLTITTTREGLQDLIEAVRTRIKFERSIQRHEDEFLRLDPIKNQLINALKETQTEKK